MPHTKSSITYQEFLNLFTTAPHATVDKYYRFYKLGQQSQYAIPAGLIAEYLEMPLANLEQLIHRNLTADRDYIMG